VVPVKVKEILSANVQCLLSQESAPAIDIKNFKIVTGIFVMDKERYFFRTETSMAESLILLKNDFPLFKLQRRKYFRVEIPERLKATFEVKTLNKIPSLLVFPILDVSNGGCRSKVSEYNFIMNSLKLGDQLRGVLHIPGKISLPLEAEVRNVSDKKTVGKDTVRYLGIKFVEMKVTVDRRLFNLTLELNREIHASDHK
jgi:c-di-GMP-binding flagellar brake protein YcgR